MLCRPRLAARFCHALLTFCCGRTLVANTGTTNITETTRFLTNHSQLQAYGFEMISTSLAPNRSGFTLIPSLMPSIPIFTVKAFGLQPSFCAVGVKVCGGFMNCRADCRAHFDIIFIYVYLYIYIYIYSSHSVSLCIPLFRFYACAFVVCVSVLCAPQTLSRVVGCSPGAHVEKQRRCASLSCPFSCESLRPCSTTL